MYRCIVLIISLLSLFTPPLFAQNSRLNGIWVAPILMADGPKFLALTLDVIGDTLTGAISNTGRSDERITNAKIENGDISFSLPKEEEGGVTLEISYRGTLKDDKHLDLVEEWRTTGIKVPRKPSFKAPPNTLEGEWGWSNLQTTVFHVQGGVLNGEVIDEFVLAENHEILAEVPERHPFSDGQVHGNGFRYRYKDRWNNSVTCTGTIVGNHLVISFSHDSLVHAVRIADAQK